jgi:hypothetical protein
LKTAIPTKNTLTTKITTSNPVIPELRPEENTRAAKLAIPRQEKPAIMK